MKGKNVKKEKVSSHLAWSPHTHAWAHHTDGQHPHAHAPHAPTRTPAAPHASTQTPCTPHAPRTHTRADKGARTTKEVEEKCYP